MARSAFGVRPRIDPRFLDYHLRLSSRPSQLFFCAVVGLLPGTWVVAVSEGIATVHILDASADAEASLGNLETHVGNLFGLPITAAGGEQ